MLKNDGVLAMVREYEGEFYLITSQGYMGRLTDLVAADMLTFLSWVGFCTRHAGEGWWYLKPEPLSEAQQAWADRLNGPTGDCIIARLLTESR